MTAPRHMRAGADDAQDLGHEAAPRHLRPSQEEPTAAAPEDGVALKRGPVVPAGGFLMALADSVPGVSGGTIAFILGIYDSLLFSLDRLVSGTSQERKQAVFFLLKLFSGWLVGFVAAVLVLTRLFESHIYVVSSVFLGFIVLSVPLIVREERANLKGGLSNALWVLLGAAIVVGVTVLNTGGGDAASAGPAHDLMHLGLGSGIYLFFCAMIAVSAMILPGISGSTFLLIFGIYIPIMGCIKALLGLDFSALPAVAVFAAGCAVGLLTVVKLVKLALERFRSQTVFVLIGFMLGSLYAIACGPATLDVPLPPLTPATFSPVGFLVGCAAIVSLELAKRRLKAKEEARS